MVDFLSSCQSVLVENLAWTCFTRAFSEGVKLWKSYQKLGRVWPNCSCMCVQFTFIMWSFGSKGELENLASSCMVSDRDPLAICSRSINLFFNTFFVTLIDAWKFPLLY